MTKNLKGLRVLNTRPLHQAQQLSQSIEEAGGIAIECPTLEIKATKPKWITELPPFDQVDIAIFVSANAVHCCFKELFNRSSWPNHIHVIAIGQATAQALNTYQIRVHDIPNISDSEHIVNLPALKHIKQKTILFFKGQGGRRLIESYLKNQQAHLFCLELYKRTVPKSNSQFIQSIWRKDLVDIILVTSEQSLKNLFKLFGPKGQVWLRSKTCLVISKRLEKAASELGMQHIILSSPEGILNSLLSYNNKDTFMPKENEQQITKEGIEPPKTENKSKPSVKSNPHLGIYILITILIILTIAGFSTTLYLWRKEHKQHNRELAFQISKLKEDQEQVKNLQNNINDFKKQWNKEFTQSTYQNQDWLLLKARYYLELAEITVQWSRDYATAIALYQQADTLFKQFNEAKFLEIREAIAKDIAQLKAIPSLDSAGLISQLEATQASVAALTFQINTKAKVTNQATTFSTDSFSWRVNLKSSMEQLSKLVIIRKDNEQIDAMISPLFQSLIKENIVFNLQSAEWAVLNYKPQAFQLALKQAIQHLTKLAKNQDPQVDSLIQQLKTMQKTFFPEKKPVTGQSLVLLNQLIKEKEHPVKPVTE